MLGGAILLMLAAQGAVTKILVTPLAVHDASGKEIKRIDRKLIKVPAPIIGSNRFGQVAIKVDGEAVYVRRADVQYDENNVCADVASGPASPALRAGGIPGLKAGAGSEDTSCVPR